jgi:ABC-type glycerol-3-phosphate transport system permease component
VIFAGYFLYYPAYRALSGADLPRQTMALVTFQGSAQSYSASYFDALMASYALACIPLAIIFGFLLRYRVERLTSGALKL